MNRSAATEHPLVKICGLQSADMIDAAIAAGADMIGLVIFPPSPRNVSIDDAAALARHAGDRTEVVALTVDADDDLVDQICARVKPNWLQLHGKESPERSAAVRQRAARPVMKAIGVNNAEDIQYAMAYRQIADRLLFDAKPPKDATRPGGLGVEFDWTLMESLDRDIAFMLSGGLTIENVAHAVAMTRPLGVDVSSGVERTLANKDADMIGAFIAAARGTA